MNYLSPELPPSVSEFEKLVLSRRSIRLFDSTPVPEKVIEHSLDMALLAPNSSNLQPWEFYWVKTPELKRKLVEACLSQAAAATAQELVVCVARTDTWERERKNMVAQLDQYEKQGTRIPKAATHYYRDLVPGTYRQGWLSAFGYVKKLIFFFRGLKTPTPREPTSHHQMQIWAVKSASLACENFMLAVRAHDFDTCPMEGFDSARVRKLLELPKHALIPMIIAVGRRGPKGVTLPRIRGERSSFVKTV